MALMSKLIPTNTKLAALLEKAAERWNHMSAEEKKKMAEAQRRSWVVGEMMLDHPDMTREYAENLYNKIV